MSGSRGAKIYTLYWWCEQEQAKLSVTGRGLPIARLYRTLENVVKSDLMHIDSQFGRRISIQDLEASIR